MDEIKLKKRGDTHGRGHAYKHAFRTGKTYRLVRGVGRAAIAKRTRWSKILHSEFVRPFRTSRLHQIYAGMLTILIVMSIGVEIITPLLTTGPNSLDQTARAVLPTPNENFGKLLKLDTKTGNYTYNEGYTAAMNPEASAAGSSRPRLTASFDADPAKGMTVSDPVNSINVTLKPKFRLDEAKQDQNQLFYKLGKANGYLVHTAQVAQIKEDILLRSSSKDTMKFEYELGIDSGLQARLEKNGSVGVYGSSLPINGDVSTGTEEDAKLLEKARQSSTKDKLLFQIPAPVVKESGQTKSSVDAKFELEGTKLTIVAKNLKSANYPLTIDPSVYVQSAAQLMRGNNESNVAFDVDNELFKKGSTTGARIDEWTDTTDMSGSVWDQGTAAAGGYMYRAGGKTSRVKPRIMDYTVTQQSTDSVTLPLALPAVRPAGDLYIALLCHDDPADRVSQTGGGWTEYADLDQFAAYYKVGTDQGGGNEAASYNFTIAATEQSAGVIIRVKDFDITSPVASTGNATGVPQYPALTANQEGTLMISGVGIDDDLPETTGYSPAGFEDIVSVNSDNNASANDCGLFSSEYYNPPRSGVSTGAATLTTANNDNYGAASLSIRGMAVTQAIQSSVEWAHFNSTTGAIDSPTPGTSGGPCSGWCTNSVYDLPTDTSVTTNGAGKVGMSMVAYNGYLYVMGGFDGTQIKSTVYVAKLGSNGEPSKWHPTDPDKANWTYWHKDVGLSGGTAKAYHSAYAYNGKMYVLGGDTNITDETTGATNAVHVADILPNGTLGSWSSGQSLPAARHGAAVQGYNGYLYLLGGVNNTTMLSTAHYSRLNSDGTMNAWQVAAADGVTTGFTTGRSSNGGQMSGIWGGYIYLSGGCAVINSTANGYCTTTAKDVQLASINADGTLDNWNTILGLNNKRFGYSFIAWQDSLYRFGGCEFQDPSTGECYATHKRVQYGNINGDGDASTVSITSATGAGLCQGSDPYDCNLPPGGTGSGQGGQALSATAILNGYLYVIGGCTTNACTTMSGNTSYAAIDSDGKLKSPPSCAGGTYGSWCVDNTNQISGGVGAAGVAVFGGTIYLVGGQDGSAGTGDLVRNTVNADGSLAGAWTSQTLTGAGAISVSYTFAYARANPGSAGSNPGNLYIFGGCGTPATGAGCTTDTATEAVYKCNITTAGAVASCSTASQLQIGTPTGGNAPGLGIHAGTVYANYIYLIGGVGRGVLDLKTIRYAKFDNSNNVVAVSGSAWIESPNETSVGRRRGTAFGYNGYLYVVGGYDAAVGGTLDDIQFSKFNVSDGSISAFETSAVTINQRWGLGMAVSNSYAYVIGGCKDGTSPTCNANGLDDTVQTFQIYNNDSGAPGRYTTSANLYATDRIGASAAVLNGYMYIAGGCVSATDCTDATDNVQYAAIDANGVLGAWANTTDATLPGQRAYGQLEVAGGTLYFIGGQDDSGNASADVYYGTPSGGNVSSWADVSNDIPAARTQHSATVWNNRIYVTGGNNTNASGTAQTTIYASPQLNSGGDIGSAWTTTGMTAFNVARNGHVAIAYANNLYILGGYTGSVYLSDVQYTQINSDGTLDSWNYTTSLPSPLRQADGFASNGYMYLYGGRSSTNDCTERTLISPISANTTITSGNNPTGLGEWYQTNRHFDGGRYGSSAVNNQGKAYVLGGGCLGTVMQDDFDTSLDSPMWTSTTGMTVGTTCQSTSDSNVLYMTDGASGANGAITKDVNVTSGGTLYFKFFSPTADGGGCFAREQNGFLGGSPDDVLLRYSTNGGTNWTTLATYAYNGAYDPIKRIAVTVPSLGANTRFQWYMPQGEASDSFAIEDVSIVATGSTAVAYASSSRVTQTPLLSQPQVAIYSRLIDADNDVFPTNWLMNGLDNSIGARWQMSYRSMNDPTVTDSTKACGGSAMSGYGQLTNFGNVNLGQPEAYVVKNSGGTNISCGRYFFMNVSIDASQTYGYPDDITRGPTLSDLTLFFRSNAAKRLIHGKTFIEGTQQPLDTPCGRSNPADVNDACPNP